MSGYGDGTTVDFPGGLGAPSALQRVRDKASEPVGEKGVETSSTGLRIRVNDDGSVDLDQPAPAVRRQRDTSDFYENLAKDDSIDLSGIAMNCLDGVAQDILSRSQFIANYNRGIDLLGLKVEDASSARGSRQSISRIKSPALLKACTRSQSLSQLMLLPASGPAKIVEIGGGTTAEDELARKFESDFNYFLTDVAKEYYPDTTRALFYRAYGGSMYKKVYRCPIRQRPVSESVQLDSLIVSEDATDLANAIRKTNEILVSPATMRRMQMIKGGWLDTSLSAPQISINPSRRKILESQGLAPVSTRTQDIQHTVYETYLSFDLAEYGFDEPAAPEGLPLPYKVVIDKDSSKVLALHRNWKKGDELYRERQVFVKYGLVPGLGFLDYGFLHLIGNQTRVLTAIWQILVDHGMISNFPAGMKVKGVRTTTNEINPGLGEWPEVDIGAMDDIRKAFMGLPYGQIDGSLIKLLEMIEADVDKMSGMIEMETGAERTNMPVGSILAMIEQQSQDLTAVHQRDHRSQKEELCLLRDLFIENPEDLKWLSRKNGTDWKEKIAEFSDMQLVPASDPNVPSQAHRIMLNQFLLQLAEKAPMLFTGNMRKVGLRVLTSVGINDADSMLASEQQIEQAMQPQPKGGGGNTAAAQASIAKAQMELPLEQAKVANDAKRIALDQEDLQRQAANEAAQHEQADEHHQAEMALDQAKLEQTERQLQAEGMANAPDQQDNADLRKTNAQAFQAMGQGAQGFANAAQTVRQGEQDLASLDGGVPAPQTQPPAKPLQQPKNGRKKPSSKAE